MRPNRIALLALLLTPLVADACSFCGGASGLKSTLREEYARATAVVAGTLKNPTYDPDRRTGTTEFHFDTTLKAAKLIEKRTSITLQKYIPVIGNTPPAYLMFFAESNGQPDGVFGIASTEAVVDYLAAIAKLDETDPARRLAFFFAHLDSKDATVSADAFAEFAKASDADVLKAKAYLDPKRLAKLLTDPKTPIERMGVFAMMLGLCGDATHADTFKAMLRDTSERVTANLGGLLAGLTMVDATNGWAVTRGVLTDGKRPFDQRLSALAAVKYFQTTRPKETRDEVLVTYKQMIVDPDLTDMAVEDLRRWQWWDLTANVLAAYPKVTAPIQRKAIAKYALKCPDEAAKAFVDALRTKEPKLLAAVEESLRLEELPGK